MCLVCYKSSVKQVHLHTLWVGGDHKHICPNLPGSRLLGGGGRDGRHAVTHSPELVIVGQLHFATDSESMPTV